MSNPVVRYSDEELNAFKDLIETKIRKAQEQLDDLMEQILETTENSSGEHGGDWVDDSSINSEMEMLNNMAIRQRMYLQELKNALIRIRNKSYGICVVTGELIDKKRLLAVPTTTKSLAAKTGGPSPAAQPKPAPRPLSKSDAKPKVITKVIRKSSATGNPKPPVDDEDDLEELDFDLYPEEEEEDSLTDSVPDLDHIPDEDTDF